MAGSNSNHDSSAKPPAVSSISLEEELFFAALEMSEAARISFLDASCAGQPDLRLKVEQLLRAEGAANEFLDCPPVMDTLRRDALVGSEETPGMFIDRYQLLSKLGEGGCGVVYLAQQSTPVQRKVALKIVRLGMDTREVIARFQSERQTLAVMEHPHIARVFDGGATSRGRPYFVMELVRGIKITEYCDRLRMSVEDRLRLFIQVCQAIQHAHQKGVVHRDIKPSNILVATHDGCAVPKVIDFGIAKATQSRFGDHTLDTAGEFFLGTPVYMSPEQAESSRAELDTRSDVYSLGALLYELLTGTPVFDPQRLAKAGIEEIRRTLREDEPVRPSQRIRAQTASAGATARARDTDPARLAHRVQGDMDWIVLRCLEKNRDRRYATVRELISDLQRFLADEAVEARPPSRIYLLGKFVRRNQLAVGSAAAIVAALFLGLGVSTWIYSREKVARTTSEARERLQRAQREDAEKRREYSEKEAAREAATVQRLTELLRRAGVSEAEIEAGVLSTERERFQAMRGATAGGQAESSPLAISVSGRIGDGSGSIITSFTVPGSKSAEVLVRGIGPSLSQFGVNDALQQPSLAVYDSRGMLVASNTSWSNSNATAAEIMAAARRAGLFPINSSSADSALLLNLAPGDYVVQLSSADGGSGSAHVEVNQVPQPTQTPPSPGH